MNIEFNKNDRARSNVRPTGSRTIRIMKHMVVDRACAEILWSIYEPNIQRIQQGTPFRQGLTKDEFDAAMSDQTFLKFILYADDEIVGFTIVATDLGKITWLSKEFFRQNYPQSATCYLVALAIEGRHSANSMLGGRQLIQAMADDIPRGAVLVYDFSRSLHSSFSHLGPSMARRLAAKARIIDSLELWEAKH
jgi:hypothetical protein